MCRDQFQIPALIYDPPRTADFELLCIAVTGPARGREGGISSGTAKKLRYSDESVPHVLKIAFAFVNFSDSISIIKNGRDRGIVSAAPKRPAASRKPISQPTSSISLASRQPTGGEVIVKRHRSLDVFLFPRRYIAFGAFLVQSGYVLIVHHRTREYQSARRAPVDLVMRRIRGGGARSSIFEGKVDLNTRLPAFASHIGHVISRMLFFDPKRSTAYFTALRLCNMYRIASGCRLRRPPTCPSRHWQPWSNSLNT